MSVESAVVGHAKLLNDSSESSQPFDICIEWTDSAIGERSKRTLVEVKGTSRSTCELSASQVDAAKANGAQYVVVVVSDERVVKVFRDPVRMWNDGLLRCDWLIRI